MAEQYYYELLGQEFGPVSLSALQMLVRGGQLGTDARVRIGEDGDWAPASSFSELSGGGSVHDDDSSADMLEELSDLSEIDADYSGDSHVLSASGATPAPGDSGSKLSKSTIEVDEEKSWYCQVLGEELGPMKIDDIRHMVELQELGAADLVRSEDQQGWAPAGMQLGELFPDTSLDDLLAAAPDSSPEVKIPDGLASGVTDSDSPSIDDFELSDAVAAAASSVAPAPDDDGDFELADNVSMVDSSDQIPTAGALANASSNDADSSDEAADAAFQGMDDDDDDAAYHGLDDDDDDQPVTETEPQPSIPAATPSTPAHPPVTVPAADGTQSQSAAADLVSKAAASMQQDINQASAPKRSLPSFSFNMPDIPIEFLLKVVALIGVCVGGYYVYINLPQSLDVPTTYARLNDIYGEFKQLPPSGPERDEFIEATTTEIEAIRGPLNESATQNNDVVLDLNFAAGALMFLINSTEEDQITDGRDTFVAQMEACRAAFGSQGGDISAMPSVSK